MPHVTKTIAPVRLSGLSRMQAMLACVLLISNCFNVCTFTSSMVMVRIAPLVHDCIGACTCSCIRSCSAHSQHKHDLT